MADITYVDLSTPSSPNLVPKRPTRCCASVGNIRWQIAAECMVSFRDSAMIIGPIHLYETIIADSHGFPFHKVGSQMGTLGPNLRRVLSPGK